MTDHLIPIKRAILSVSDKEGLDVLAKTLTELKIEILSSGGTARYLKEREIPVKEISDFTGAPEMMDGRLKTLHPKIYGGILAIRENEKHMNELSNHGYPPIDLVVVNLYPFERESQTAGLSFIDIVEQIDIGGPTLLRAAAKNFPYVTVLTDLEQYSDFLTELNKHQGSTTLSFRRRSAQRVFEKTSAYDATISQFFQKDTPSLPKYLRLALRQKWLLRYGENPHQQGAFYLPENISDKTIIERVLQGKTLSYNNLMDIHAALDLMAEFDGDYTVAIFKHTNPCGVGRSNHSLLDAFERALECDPVSAFGGIIIFSHEVDSKTAEACSKSFTEILISPIFSPQSLELFSKKKNLRLVEVNLQKSREALKGHEIRRAIDGYLIQQKDLAMEDLSKSQVVTKRAPTSEEMIALNLAWKVAKHVKSNAVVLANQVQTMGIGAGQMSRVDSSRIASFKADPKKIKGSALASDAFFPFRDGVDEAAHHGVSCIVEPGGSVRDQEVIDAANEHDLAMIFTQVRHFKH